MMAINRSRNLNPSHAGSTAATATAAATAADVCRIRDTWLFPVSFGIYDTRDPNPNPSSGI